MKTPVPLASQFQSVAHDHTYPLTRSTLGRHLPLVPLDALIAGVGRDVLLRYSTRHLSFRLHHLNAHTRLKILLDFLKMVNNHLEDVSVWPPALDSAFVARFRIFRMFSSNAHCRVLSFVGLGRTLDVMLLGHLRAFIKNLFFGHEIYLEHTVLLRRVSS